jgi:hypothetical protein
MRTLFATPVQNQLGITDKHVWCTGLCSFPRIRTHHEPLGLVSLDPGPGWQVRMATWRLRLVRYCKRATNADSRYADSQIRRFAAASLRPTSEMPRAFNTRWPKIRSPPGIE